jgi:chemotaxis protein MotB
MRKREFRGRLMENTPAAPSWAITYGILVTILVAFFAILGVSGAKTNGGASISGTSGVTPTSLNEVERRLLAEGTKNQSTSGMTIEVQADALVIHLDAKSLFDSGRADFREQAVPVLDAVGAVLSRIGNSVRIEGHTDSDPMAPNLQYPDNWMLSGARAAGVLRYLHEFYQVPFQQVSIAGYADTHPVTSNATPEGKARNRRVDIVILSR